MVSTVTSGASMSDSSNPLEENFAALFEESLKNDTFKEGDIVKGKAGAYSAGPGWDFVTGLGTPQAQDLIAFLVSRSQ